MAQNSEHEIQWLNTRPGSSDRLTTIENMVTDCGEEENNLRRKK